MNDVLEILKYVVPSLVVFATAYLLIAKMLENEQRKRRNELVIANKKMITPIRLQAYERLVLFLERISPNSLIMRLQSGNMTAKQMQAEMLATIRAEYDHNVSQQIYVSSKAWKIIRSARENLVKMINTAADNVKDDAPAMELSKILLELLMKLEMSPTDAAIEVIKNEVRQYY